MSRSGNKKFQKKVYKKKSSRCEVFSGSKLSPSTLKNEFITGFITAVSSKVH